MWKKINASALSPRTPTLCNYFTIIIDDPSPIQRRRCQILGNLNEGVLYVRRRKMTNQMTLANTAEKVSDTRNLDEGVLEVRRAAIDNALRERASRAGIEIAAFSPAPIWEPELRRSRLPLHAASLGCI